MHRKSMSESYCNENSHKSRHVYIKRYDGIYRCIGCDKKMTGRL
jgi:hypothetical protein